MRFFSRIKGFVFSDRKPNSVGFGFYYSSLKKVFATGLKARFQRSENFILSSERNFYDKERVVKIPHFLDKFDSEFVSESNRGVLQVSVGGKAYSLKLVNIGGGQSVEGRRLYEIKGLDKDLIKTKRKDLAAYCIWVDADYKISDESYNTPGNLRIFFNGPVKSFSPVVRNERDKGVNIICTSIALPIFLSTLIVKASVYFVIECVGVLTNAISRLAIPAILCITSCSFITLGLVKFPFLGDLERKLYLEKYNSVFRITREIFFLGTTDYVRRGILRSDDIEDKFENIESGSLSVGVEEIRSLRGRRRALYFLNFFSSSLQVPFICTRGVVNILCSSARSISSCLFGLFTSNSEYFKAAAFLAKQPFLELGNDLRESFTGIKTENNPYREQVISFNKGSFDRAVKSQDRESLLDISSKATATSIGTDLRNEGVVASTSNERSLCFIPPSCCSVVRGL